ncbi:hypothetical protein ACH4S8_37950 [Streptomyces sp. NPDC021080]|uniref:hypothetical protein n=1 Tax=Streptomyces sp. NPDC021080 TaxID=3365110 RepID=UPI00378BDFDF
MTSRKPTAQEHVWDGNGVCQTHGTHCSMAPTEPLVPDPAALARQVARAIFALKSPAPAGSEHYRSGWDNGLEAAMDAARDAVLSALDGAACWHTEPGTPCDWNVCRQPERRTLDA